ncbi:Nuclear prelamin A recognition factor [Myotis davidii]|uniref:Nuclear prelamin A recognition factor n=1 Tax=Myotis davidii TaxID=225400 RepID=L5MFK5_MYODS|nr:Nuclear prelamin A recognition factor [Myotis davidii]
MKCEHCTRKEYSKKQKPMTKRMLKSTSGVRLRRTERRENAPVSLMHPEGSVTSSKASKAVGCTVSDMKIAVDFSILESQKESLCWYCQHHEEEPQLLMLTSASPCWVQYAERVLGHPITPPSLQAKSRQQIMGSLVKDYFARR